MQAISCVYVFVLCILTVDEKKILQRRAESHLRVRTYFSLDSVKVLS